MKTCQIHLIRHGLTQANIDGLYCGSTDLSLCPEGMGELQRLVGEYTYPYIDLLCVSPLARARQTASILFPDCEQTVVDGLREASFGIYEGRKFSDLKNDADFQKWVTFGSGETPEGAEHPTEFRDRCVRSFTEIVTGMMREGIPTAAIVTHSGVIANILSSIAFPRKSPYDWQCYTGCGYTVLADPSLFLREPVVEVINVVPPELNDELN